MGQRIAAVDLFCGAGGLTHGLQREGIRVCAGVDLDDAARYPYEANNDALFLREDVSNLTGSDLIPYFPSHSVRTLVGCAPCQPFSTFSRKENVRSSPEWSLLAEFGRLVRETRPKIVSMENVVNLRQYSVFDRFVRTLREMGYHVTDYDAECVQFGVPQRRVRLILFGSKWGPVELIPPTHRPSRRRTVRDAIGEMPTLEAGRTAAGDPLHRAAGLNKINRKRIRSSIEGGTWRDWSSSLRVDCHRRDSGHSYGPVYGRMAWSEPSPTITTKCFNYGSGRFGHPDQNRAISLREAALLQTFPATYKFVDPKEPGGLRTLGRLIGNAVPVRLGQAIGRSISRHVAQHAAIGS